MCFRLEARHSLPELKIVGRTAALWPGAFKTVCHPQKAQKDEKRDTKTTKKSLVYNLRAETSRQSGATLDTHRERSSEFSLLCSRPSVTA